MDIDTPNCIRVPIILSTLLRQSSGRQRTVYLVHPSPPITRGPRMLMVGLLRWRGCWIIIHISLSPVIARVHIAQIAALHNTMHIADTCIHIQSSVSSCVVLWLIIDYTAAQ